MVETHALPKADAEKAKATPLKLAPPNVEASDAPYFVDLLRETLISKLDERQMNDQGYRIYYDARSRPAESGGGRSTKPE